MRSKSKLNNVFMYLPMHIVSAVKAIPDYEQNEIQEIRLRLGRKLTVRAYSKEYYLLQNGTLSNSPEKACEVTADDIQYVFRHALQESVHSYKREITQGYVTVNGGCRIGFCGSAVLDPRKAYSIENIKEISSINIRIACEITGCGDDLFGYACSAASGLLIAGAPSSGKTTVLRDLARQIGDSFSTSLIDERNEIASVFDSIPQNDIGLKTDVFTAYNKYEGIMTAIKVMSPIYLICDEIGSSEDLKALRYALNSGVKLIATCHCTSLEELYKKPIIKKLIKLKAFDRVVLLGTGTNCGKVISQRILSKTEREEARC